MIMGNVATSGRSEDRPLWGPRDSSGGQYDSLRYLGIRVGDGGLVSL